MQDKTRVFNNRRQPAVKNQIKTKLRLQARACKTKLEFSITDVSQLSRIKQKRNCGFKHVQCKTKLGFSITDVSQLSRIKQK